MPEILDELEVFIIDEGATDTTLDIAHRYAEQYPDTFIPVHKDNEGYGSTVNYSIAHATGKYFKTLDGDDWFDREGLIKLVDALKYADEDVVITSKYCRGTTSDSINIISLDNWQGNSESEANGISDKQIFNAWTITYKTDVLRCSGVILPSRKLYTDIYYYTIPFSCVKNIKYLDCAVYCYRTGRQGQSTSREVELTHTQDLIDATLDMCSFCEQKRQEGNENNDYITYRVAGTYTITLWSILMHPISREWKKELIQFDDKVKETCLSVYERVERIRGKKIVLFIRLLRATNYEAYWLLKLIPGGMHHYQ